MKLIWIAVDPTIPACDELTSDIVAVVRKHSGRVHTRIFSGGSFPGMDDGFPLGTRFCLNDIARVSGISMAQVEVLEP